MTWMIEAISQFEIPGRILRSGTDPPGSVCEQCSFYGYGTQHPGRCNRYFLVASGRDSVVSRLRAAMAGAAMNAVMKSGLVGCYGCQWWLWNRS